METEYKAHHDRRDTHRAPTTHSEDLPPRSLISNQSGDRGLFTRALQIALRDHPELSLVTMDAPPALHDLSILVQWLRDHVNIVAHLYQVSTHEAIRAAQDGAALLAPTSIGWIALNRSNVTVVSAYHERNLKLKERQLRVLVGARDLQVIYLEPHLNLEVISKQRSGGSPTSRLWALMRLERPIIGALFVYAAALGAFSLAVPIAVQVLVNTVALGSLLQPLVILSLALLLVLSLSGAVKVMEMYAVEVLQRRLFVRVSEDFARRLCVLSDAGRALLTSKRMSDRFFEVITLQKSASKLLIDGLSLALKAAVGLVLLGFYHPALLVFDLALLSTLILVSRPRRRAIQTAQYESEVKYEVATWIAQLGDQPIPLEDSSVHLERAERADALTRRYLSARRDHYTHLFTQQVSGVVLQITAMVTLLGLGGWLVMRGELTLGQLVAAELVVGAIGSSFAKLGPILEGVYDVLASVDKLGKVVDLEHTTRPIEIAFPSSSLNSTGSLVKIQGATRGLLTLTLLIALGTLFAPWQQSVSGGGRVIAYAPLDRQQTVEAPIEGKVVKWFVREGSVVREGDPIAELSDNDPELLVRLERERVAAQTQVNAAKLAVELTEARVRSEESARSSSLDTARMKVKISREKLRSAERSVDAASAKLKTARLNLKRTRKLQKSGLASQRDLELSELAESQAHNGLASARANLRAVKAAVRASEADRSKVSSSTRSSVDSTRSSLEKLRADQAKAEAELAKAEVRLARQNQMKIYAPRAGTILRLLAKQGTEMVKAGDPIVYLVPDSSARAVELYVDGNDAPLIDPGREVRLQFEGWPAVQFVGWPSVAVGTFGGVVDFIDAHGDEQGRFRVVITPKENEQWPEDRYLRQGVRANGWILLNEVSLGFELWRQFNGFPPALTPSKPSLKPASFNPAKVKQ